ncbi:MAG: hypothetical protein PVI35_02935 [Acidimicrobiia bacterium]|jgi:hypothetical protein
MTDRTPEPGPPQVTLRDEIIAVLKASTRRWMFTTEIANEVERRGNYTAGDRAITSLQIHRATRDNLHVFKRSGSRVSLRTGHS